MFMFVFVIKTIKLISYDFNFFKYYRLYVTITFLAIF